MLHTFFQSDISSHTAPQHQILRSQQQVEDTWDLTSMYSSCDDWENDIHEFESMDWNTVTAKYTSGSDTKAHPAFSATIFREIFDTYYQYERRLKKIYVYAHLTHDQDTSNDDAKKIYKRAGSQYFRFNEAFSWINSKIVDLDRQQIDSILASDDIKSYKIIIERIYRQKQHTFDAATENILAMAARATQTASKAFKALNDTDLTFSPAIDSQKIPHEVTHANYTILLRSSDRVLRMNAFKSLHSRFLENENILTELLQGQVEEHMFFAKARTYSSCLEATLFAKNIPTQVYHSLISSVRKYLPLLHSYMKVRKDLLQLDELHMWDLHLPLIEDVSLTYPYDEAVRHVTDAVLPLGAEYVDIVQKGLTQQRWVDRYANVAKRSGAYSSGSYDSYPYILLNYKEILRDVFTLAHEVGHSMHSYYSSKSQPYHYSEYEIFVAEVASTFNEALLAKKLVQTALNKKEKAYILGEKLEDIRSTLFRQTMFAEFELFIHETIEQGKPLTSTLLKEYYRQLNHDYFGPDVIIDDEIAIEWARVPHFYYNFYVYQYATGICAALALVEKVAAGDEQQRLRYLSFLQSGGSLFPIEALKSAGIDMSSAEPVELAMKYFASLLEEFKNLALDN